MPLPEVVAHTSRSSLIILFPSFSLVLPDFYYLFESRRAPSTDPLIVWLTGGPGCSSLLALFTENGPCSISRDGFTHNNPYSWTTHANVMWIDQPAGASF